MGSFLDRLGRSVKNLVDLVSKLHRQRVQFKSLTDAIDTCTANIWPRWGRSASEGRKTASTDDKATRIPPSFGKILLVNRRENAETLWRYEISDLRRAPLAWGLLYDRNLDFYFLNIMEVEHYETDAGGIKHLVPLRNPK